MANSTAIGNVLEDEVFALLPRWISDAVIPVSPENVNIHRRKSYYSKMREGSINFENVVEVFSSVNISSEYHQPMVVFIFECKNTSRRVDVQEVEEFHSKLDNSLGFRTKGFIVSLRGFTSGAVKRARNCGVGLIRIMPDDQVEFVMYYLTPDVLARLHRELPQRTLTGLTDENYQSQHESVFCTLDGRVFEGVGGLIRYASSESSTS